MKAQSKKIAVIGFGYWGQKLAAASVKAGLEVAIVDTMTRSAVLYPQCSWETVLTDADIFGVIIATPEKTHAKLALEALQAGKAVLVEKPATTTVASWQQCMSLATEKNLPLLVDYTFLYSQALQQWLPLQQTYGSQLGQLKKITTVRKTNMTPERIVGKALPIWWDVVIHDLYLFREVFDDTPADWQVLSAQLPSQIKLEARLAAVELVADYSWLAATPERSWLAEYEQGSLLWQRIADGESFEVTLNDQKVFSTVVADQNPSPLDALIHHWMQLWHQKNLGKIQKKHWTAVKTDIAVLTKLSDSLTAQLATR